ncbi:katanin p60 ATPase-containing subunit A-like 2 [Thalassophryne amazonica]|uniref:katanin p60 ATPase-containing subunit A-like 2 n=1 Tax=Thalassophryne amazonica TaxID=390379 RepID=UPI0014718758|nr:katanin p60 ATPase-containing subunit A-like 2 [Thalassophryne amazonica]
MKISHQIREADELRTETRRKSLLILIYHHLQTLGYMDAAVALDQETNGGVRKFEWRVELEECWNEEDSVFHCENIFRKSVCLKHHRVEAEQSGPTPRQRADPLCVRRFSEFGLMFCLLLEVDRWGDGTINRKGQLTDCRGLIQGTSCESEHMERLLKPLSGFSGLDSEMRELAAVISRDIYLHSPNVRWEDIIGLGDAKRLVKEAVVYPIKYPQLFTGILSPWKGLLLYGPPGTGKTLLAKAVATECKTTFFNISASSIVSKWRGDSEKLVRVLFELARYHAPSTIFLDELESVMGQRGTSPGGEHEGSRRMKTELLVQMDGLSRSDDLVFVLAASNLPWELDHAMLRRLEKRILVGLPSLPARQAMISHWLPSHSTTGGVELQTELDYETLAKAMDGYSGSDVRLVCKEAAMRPVRKIFDVLESHSDAHAVMSAIRLQPVTTVDFLEVIAHTKPSARNLIDRYTAWETEYESV